MATSQQTPSKKVWFLTGASRGFGRAWTEDILARGDRVAATVRDAKALDDLRAKYGDDRLLVLTLDVTDRERVFSAVQRTHAHFGRLDVVLSNAGYGLEGAVEEVRIEDVRANFETNVFGTLHVIQAAVPLLRAQGAGHILPVSSMGGLVPFPIMGIYTATKHALEAIGEALATEVKQFGIRVTLIEPGPYKTDFLNTQAAYVRSKHAHKEYDDMRDALLKHFDGKFGDAHATSAALFQLVDETSQEPPLRLILGDSGVAAVRQRYAERLESITRFEQVSVAAQGVSS